MKKPRRRSSHTLYIPSEQLSITSPPGSHKASPKEPPVLTFGNPSAEDRESNQHEGTTDHPRVRQRIGSHPVPHRLRQGHRHRWITQPSPRQNLYHSIQARRAGSRCQWALVTDGRQHQRSPSRHLRHAQEHQRRVGNPGCQWPRDMDPKSGDSFDSVLTQATGFVPRQPPVLLGARRDRGA